MKELHSDTSNEPSLSLSQSPFSVVHIENKAEGTTYLVEFCDSEILRNNEEDVEDAGIPIIFSIKAGMSGSPQTEIKFTQINQDELLTVIVQAMDRRGMISRNDVNLFKINGATYSFYYSDEDMNNISNFELIDIQTDRSAAEFLNTALLNNPTIRVATRHYNGTDKSIESIIKQWFTDRRGLKKLLRTVFTDIQNGKTTTALSRQQIIEVLNIIDKTKNATDDLRSATTEDLINTIQPKLASKGINIEITTEVERQAIADANSRLRLGGEETVRRDSDDKRFFISASGDIVYGFVKDHKDGTHTIYLDADLLNPETFIHEYTHLWTTLFRAANPSGWTKLVSELRQHSGELWNNIVKTYGHDVQRLEKDPKTGKEVWKDDDDKIADEAFAHAVGKEGESLIAAHYDSNIGSMGIINYIKQKFESLLTYIKNYFNLSPYARALEQLVLKDMLSDNPLENFGEVAEALDPNKKAEGHSTVKPFVLNLGDFLNSGHFVRVYRTKFKFDLTKGTVEIPGTYSDKDLRKMGYKGTIRREHRALRESYMHPIMGLADSVFGGHMLYIIIGIVVR